MSVRTFTLFHLSLIPVLEPIFETPQDVSREGWLRNVLAESFEFPYHGGELLHWVPQGNVMNLICGVIEKVSDRAQHLPPNQGGAEVIKKEWQGAFAIIDPTPHDDGQKMAIENDLVGNPQTLAKYLFKFLNQVRERPFEVEARPIFDSSEFSEFLELNGPVLKYVKFHFVVPNMWDTAKRLDKELKETGDETGAEELDVTFKSRKGLRGDSDRVREGVEYAARGAGNVKAKAANGKKFNSDLAPTQTRVEAPEQSIVDDAQSWIRESWRRILGRE